MGGHTDGCKHHLLGSSRESSPPGDYHFSSITFLPVLPQEEVRNHRSWSPRDPTSRRQPSEAPTSGCHPFPRCPHFLGSLATRMPHFRSSLPLKGPSPWPPGHTGSQALTGPATGRSAGQSAAGASSGSAHRTDPHSPPGRPGRSRRK